ncbi:MAG: hypothetical protein PHE16_07015 [Aliarcobacter sp.]|nr:hypothetical protein [Aliarcobacter sp.]
MEYGILPKINQFSDNKALEVQKVQQSAKSSQITTEEAIQQVQQEAISKEKELTDTKKVEASNSSTSNKYEVVLSNTNFGYNGSSKDFYVKVERGNVENQYPTEDMMKTKAYLMSLESVS